VSPSRLSAEFLSDRDEIWARLPVLARPDADAGDDVEYVGIHRDGQPYALLVVKDHRSRSAFSAVACINDVVFVGIGESLYVVSFATQKIDRYPMRGYFGSLYLPEDVAEDDADIGVFVASASDLYRFSADGMLLWRSVDLGIDGVLVYSVEQARIRGSGEWDPPGGWRPFVLDLMTGQAIDQSA
jgi:hypothetical protein